MKEGDLELPESVMSVCNWLGKRNTRLLVLFPLSQSIDRKALAAEAAEKETEPEPEPIVKRRRLVLRDYQN